MIRRILSRLYARLFDLPDQAVRLDPGKRAAPSRVPVWRDAAECAPGAADRMGPDRGCGLHRRRRQVSAGAPNPFLPTWVDLLHLFIAGWLVGLSWQAIRLGRTFALLAILRGERVDRLRPHFSGSPASSSTSSSSS